MYVLPSVYGRCVHQKCVQYMHRVTAQGFHGWQMEHSICPSYQPGTQRRDLRPPPRGEGGWQRKKVRGKCKTSRQKVKIFFLWHYPKHVVTHSPARRDPGADWLFGILDWRLGILQYPGSEQSIGVSGLEIRDPGLNPHHDHGKLFEILSGRFVKIKILWFKLAFRILGIRFRMQIIRQIILIANILDEI